MKGYSYCTCVKSKQKLVENSERNSKKIRLVEVDKEGICLDCGYYAVSCHKEVKDGFELYHLLRADKEDVENRYLTDSIVETFKETQKEWQEKSTRKNKYTV